MNAKKWCAVGIVGTLLFAFYSAYAMIYYAWLTATPLTPQQLKRAQYDAKAWCFILCFTLLAMTAIAFQRCRLSKKGKAKPVQYQLRQCTEEDREWAYALKSEAYREVVERQFGPWDEKFQRELFRARWNPTISKIVLIDGAAVGLVAVEDRRDELWIDEVQVDREWRGKGLGSAVVGDLIDRARTGRKPLRLQVLKENTRAQTLYRRLEFCVTGETETHILMENRGSRIGVNTRTWLNAEKTYEGFPLYLRRPAKLDVRLLQRRFPKLLIVTHQFSKRLPNGLPDPDYNDSLRPMDGDLASLFDSEQSGVIVLVETFGGKRHYYYYVCSDGDVASTVDGVVRKYPEERLSWSTKSDPRWSFLDRYSKEHF